jgi:hypothetical protein
MYKGGMNKAGTPGGQQAATAEVNDLLADYATRILAPSGLSYEDLPDLARQPGSPDGKALPGRFAGIDPALAEAVRAGWAAFEWSSASTTETEEGQG